jgi:hypothetical protein
MKKSIVGFIIAGLSALLAFSFLPRMIQYLVHEESEPVYHRVEAERYEVVFPINVNGTGYTVGGLYCGTFVIDDNGLSGGVFVLEDDDLIDDNDGYPYFEFYVYLDSVSVSICTDNHVVLQGEYGRYLISETQVADEPVAFTLEPIYEYVLVD